MLPRSKLQTCLTLVATSLFFRSSLPFFCFQRILKFSWIVCSAPHFLNLPFCFTLSAHLLIVLSTKANPSSLCACQHSARGAKSTSLVTSMKRAFPCNMPCGILPSVNMFILVVFSWHFVTIASFLRSLISVHAPFPYKVFLTVH